MSQQLKHTTEEQLLNARREGLEQMRDRTTMRAYGKVAGMDVFSWMNPDMEAFVNVISTMPFEVIWVGTSDQVNDAFKWQESLSESLLSAVIYDTAEVMATFEWLNTKMTLACVEGLESALQLVQAMQGEGRAVVFTAPKDSWEANHSEFEKWVQMA